MTNLKATFKLFTAKIRAEIQKRFFDNWRNYRKTDFFSTNT